jgi:hypothetical protein
VKSRVGDRRAHLRFEILGTLQGSVETSRRYEVREVSAIGALIEATELLEPGVRLKGRLVIAGRHEKIDAEVRETHKVHGTDSGRYLIGIEFGAPVSGMVDDLLLERPNWQVTDTVLPAGERRRGPRLYCAGHGHLEIPAWTTVALHDVSLGGTMFTSDAALQPHIKGRLKTHFGTGRFAADLEIRRIQQVPSLPPPPAGAVYRMGAAFLVMDGESRRNLTAFLAAAES